MEPSPLKGSKTALLGIAGSGKTFSLRTLHDIPELRKIVLFTENAADRIADLPDFHWATCMPGASSLEEVYEVANLTHTISFKELTNMDHFHRERYNNFLDLIVTLNDFPDVRTGQKLGPATSWGPDTVLAIDGGSNLCRMVIQHIVGAKPMMSQPQYGLAQGALMQFLILLTTSLNCHVIVIWHIEQVLDETTNLYKNMIDAIGKAIAPDIPKLFGDVILAQRQGLNYSWTNADEGSVTKAGLLLPSTNMPPTFVPLFEAWRKKGGLYSPTYKENLTTEGGDAK